MTNVRCVNVDCPEEGIVKECRDEWVHETRCGECNMLVEEVTEDAS